LKKKHKIASNYNYSLGAIIRKFLGALKKHFTDCENLNHFVRWGSLFPAIHCHSLAATANEKQYPNN